MCLVHQYSKINVNKFKNLIPKEGMKVFKVAKIKDGKYYPLVMKTTSPYQEGINQAEETTITDFYNDVEYIAGYHFYLKREYAESLMAYAQECSHKNLVVIECTIKAEWITAMGIDHTSTDKRETVVVSKAIFPKTSIIE